MNLLRSIIDGAVAEAVAEHPKYFTPRGQEKARDAIVRKIMAAFRGDDEKGGEESPTTPPPYLLFKPEDREARGYANLRRLAGALPPRKDIDGFVIVMSDACRESVYALADLPPRDEWLFLTTNPNITAWREFFHLTLPDVARRQIVETRDGVVGILMPWCWPPRKDGRVYDTPEVAA